MAFWWGVLATLAVGLVLAIAIDKEIRDALLTLGWALLIGAPLTLWLGAVWLSRYLPERIRPRRLRGRKLSSRALQRIADRAQHHGWTVQSPAVAIIVLKRKRG